MRDFEGGSPLEGIPLAPNGALCPVGCSSFSNLRGARVQPTSLSPFRKEEPGYWSSGVAVTTADDFRGRLVSTWRPVAGPVYSNLQQGRRTMRPLQTRLCTQSHGCFFSFEGTNAGPAASLTSADEGGLAGPCRRSVCLRIPMQNGAEHYRSIGRGFPHSWDEAHPPPFRSGATASSSAET